MIKPNNKFKHIWDAIIILTTISAAVEIPIRILFAKYIVPEFAYLEWGIPFLFTMDIFVNFRTAIILERKVVVDQGQVARNYIRGWFWIDLLAAIPFDTIIGIIVPASLIPILPVVGGLDKLFRLTHMLRLGRIFVIFNRWQRANVINASVLRLMTFVFWILLTAHWIACVWLLLDGIAMDLEPLTRYIHSLYWTVTTLATVGYGDIVPRTNGQMVFTILVMLLGVGIYGYVIGNIASLLANIDVAKAQYKERMDMINAFLKYRNIPPHLSERILNYYHYLWESRMGYDERSVLADLPSGLKTDVSLYLNKDIIEKVPLFKGASEELIRNIVLELKPLVATPGDFIFRKGELGTKMYFISRGRVEVLGEDGESILAMLTDGNFFGEIALLMKQPRTASVRSADYCDLYTLEKSSFDRILEKDAAFAKSIREMASKRTGENIHKHHLEEKHHHHEEKSHPEEEHPSSILMRHRSRRHQGDPSHHPEYHEHHDHPEHSDHHEHHDHPEHHDH